MRNCIVLGSGRSGTSMVAGTLARAGYFMGDRLYPGRDSNPRGFFEDPEVNGINEELLAPHVAASERLVAPQRWLARLDRTVGAPLPDALRRRVRALVARAPFCFKDPRFCYTLPAWQPELGDARRIVVFRDPLVTASSIVKECAHAEYLRGVAMDPKRALELWCAMYRQVLQQHRDAGESGRADWLFVHYDQLVHPALRQRGLDRLGRFLGASIDATFPTDELRRSQPVAAEHPEATRLYAELCRLSALEAAAPIAAPIPDRGAPPPEISVLICTYRRRDTLLECLQSFAQQTLAPERYELVVVVDESGDGSAQAVRSFRGRAPLRLIERAQNAGLASARSAAVAAARGEILLLVNDDTIAFPDLLERHLDAHRRRAPRPVSVLGTFEQPREQLSGALMRVLERSHLVFGYEGLRSDVDHDWTKFWGCNVSAPRQDVIAAGSFDATFHHYGCEDTDLGIRLDLRGLPVVYEPAARSWHRHVLSFDDVAKRQKTVARAYVRLFAKHPEPLERSWFGRRIERPLAETAGSVEKSATVQATLLPVARALAALDCATLEALGGPLAEVATQAVAGLTLLLKRLDPIWWDEGFAEGLRELGVARFRELAGWRTDGATPTWPLATAASFRVLAWPRWDEPSELDGELEALLRTATDPRLAAAPCLCLRHDPACDGDVAAARRRLEAVAARVTTNGRDLEVLLVDEPIPVEALPRLARAVTCALLLPSSLQGERARFFVRAGAPGVRGVEDLLAFAPAANSATSSVTLPVEPMPTLELRPLAI
jgi:GT2 family glycosyltransferase